MCLVSALQTAPMGRPSGTSAELHGVLTAQDGNRSTMAYPFVVALPASSGLSFVSFSQTETPERFITARSEQQRLITIRFCHRVAHWCRQRPPAVPRQREVDPARLWRV